MRRENNGRRGSPTTGPARGCVRERECALPDSSCQSALFIQAAPAWVKHTRVNPTSRVLLAPLYMSLSPTNSTKTSPVVPSKRRRAPANQQPPQPLMDESPTASGATSGHIPKRGARACTACRKGKNRCEGEVSTLSVRADPRPAHRALWPVATAPARGQYTGPLSSLSVERSALHL
jgi:hypothetical protein